MLRKEADRVDAQLADISTTLHAEDQEVAEINYKEMLAERGHPLGDDQRETEFDKLEPG